MFATGDRLLYCGSLTESGASEEYTRVCFCVCVGTLSVCCRSAAETPTERWTRPGGI